MSFSQALVFVFLSQGMNLEWHNRSPSNPLISGLGGLLLSAAFSVNHNGMEIFERGTQATIGFAQLQAVTARDVTGGAWVPW
jgi:hypothetical protein